MESWAIYSIHTSMKPLEEFEKQYSLDFHDKFLLETAFTHRSYVNESGDKHTIHNERLEFLGDAVLEILVSEYLFYKFPDLPEGLLTTYRSASVRMESLADVSLELGLGLYLRMAKGEEATGGRTKPYILANTFEAFLGALFLDQGIEACKKFLSSVFFGKIDKVITEKTYVDNKSRLQELLQEKSRQMPTYKVLQETGPDHDKTFIVGVYLKNAEMLGRGVGKTKQQAQQEAAKEALQKLGQ